MSGVIQSLAPALCLLAALFACSDNDPQEPQAVVSAYRGKTGCLSGNCVSGRGIFVEADGERYEGEWDKGKRDGIGVATWPDGSSYIGQWRADSTHGKGIYVKSDGERYEGDWAGGRREGAGKSFWPDGSKYEGQFMNDRPHGRGRFTGSDGTTYEGEFANGKAHGTGVLTRQGKRIATQWIEGRPAGKK